LCWLHVGETQLSIDGKAATDCACATQAQNAATPCACAKNAVTLKSNTPAEINPVALPEGTKPARVVRTDKYSLEKSACDKPEGCKQENPQVSVSPAVLLCVCICMYVFCVFLCVCLLPVIGTRLRS